MEKIEKAEESGDLSSFSYLPDEIVLEILRRVIDLKSLCFCKLVCIRFNLIIPQVNAISFTFTRVDHPTSTPTPTARVPVAGCLYCECRPFVNVIVKSLQTFSGLKSLCIEIPPPPTSANNMFSFKWSIKFGNSIDSYLFVSPNSIFDMKDVKDDEEEDDDEVKLSKKKDLACDIFGDALCRHVLLFHCIKGLPLLESVTITESDKRGRLSLCGEIIVELRNSPDPYSNSETIEQWMESLFKNMMMHQCYVPLLKLPDSGYMMKGGFLLQIKMSDLPGDDSLMNMNLNDSEDKEEASYSEAVMEIFKKHRGRIERLHKYAFQ